MTTHVQALYDFSGEPNTSELSIRTDEILVLTRTDVGDGWWEGTNRQGQTGLFPQAYVQIYHAPASAAPIASPAVSTFASPGPVAAAAVVAANPPRYDQSADDWTHDGPDDWDDDWDEDNYSEIGPGRTADNNAPVAASHAAHNQRAMADHSTYANASSLPSPPSSSSGAQHDDALSMSSVATSAAPLKKSGIFAKSGDSYILGTTNVSVSESERIVIVQLGNDFHWKTAASQYNVSVASPQKKTKFKGMKSFIEYNLTPSFTNVPVSRRYKHFDWLHGRLLDKFCLIPIPPLPEKQISGRYEEEFIEHRRVQLQEFVDWLCRHPVLSQCEVWMHFLTCTDKLKWKNGKRSAEKDPLVGATFCASVFPPERALLPSQVEPEMDKFAAFVQSMDGAVKLLFSVSAEQQRRFQLQWKKDYQRVGDSLSELAKALKRDEGPLESGMSGSVGQAAAVFIQIGQRFGDQPKHDWIPFSDRLHIYRGILGEFPEALSMQRAAVQKRKECERLVSDQKMGNVQMQEVNRRTDIMTYACLAEMNSFRRERDGHLKQTVRSLIDAQIEFYRDIVEKLQDARRFLE